MVYVLKIGYLSFAFPTSRGLQTVMDTLGKARELKRGYQPGYDQPEEMELEDKPVAVSMHCVPGVSFVSGAKKSRREVIEPEVMPRERGESDAVFAMRATRPRAKRPSVFSGDGGGRLLPQFERMLLEEGKK
jgi:hypothetical protein